MKLIHVTQHKPVVTSIIILWANHYVIMMPQTADHVNTCFKTICRTKESHVITPYAICQHACQVRIPRRISIYKLEKLCPIWLQDKKP